MSEQKPLKREGFLSRKVGDEWLLYDTVNESVHVINSTAQFVWEMCDGTHTRSDICRKMQDVYHVPEGTELREDVDSIITSFDELGALMK